MSVSVFKAVLIECSISLKLCGNVITQDQLNFHGINLEVAYIVTART